MKPILEFNEMLNKALRHKHLDLHREYTGLPQNALCTYACRHESTIIMEDVTDITVRSIP